MEWVRLGDLGEIVTGNTPSKKNSEYYDNKDIPFIGPSDIKNFRKLNYINESENFLSNKARNKARIVPKNSLLVTCIGNIGKVAKVETEEIAFNQQINAILVNNKNFNSDYIGYALIFNQKRLESISNAPVVPIINKTSFSDFKTRIDKSLYNQNKISKTLKIIEKIIGLRKEQIQAYDDLIESLFYEMFGNIHNSEFKITSIGSVIKSTQYGTSGKAQDINGNYKILRMGNLTQKGYLEFDDIKYIDIENKDEDKYLVKKGDILFNRTNSRELVGKTALYDLDYPMAFAGYLISVRVSNSINPLFLTRQMNLKFFKETLFIKAKVAIGMANINAKDLRSFKIINPPIELQNKFADYVLKIEEEKKKLNASLLELEGLFNSLMEDAFSGNLFKE